MERQRQSDRLLDLVDEADCRPGSQPDRRDRRAALCDPDVRAAPRGLEHVSRFSIGSPIPMNTAWSIGSMRRKCRAWSRISDAVRLRPKAHLAGCAERACQRAARLRRQAHGTPAVAEAHQHRLHGMAVVRAEQRLDGAVACFRLLYEGSRVENGTSRSKPLTQTSREVRHLLVAGGTAGCPLPHLTGAVGRRFGARPDAVAAKHDPRGQGSVAYGLGAQQPWWQRWRPLPGVPCVVRGLER